MDFIVIILLSGNVLFQFVDTNKKSPMAFTCSACGKQYKWQSGLSRHKHVECGKEPKFACHLCKYKTKHKTSLVCHLGLKHHCDRRT